MNTEIKAGQVYIEDMGVGKRPNYITIVELWSEYVRYKKRGPSGTYKMLLNRFEGLIRAEVFSLIKVVEVPATMTHGDSGSPPSPLVELEMKDLKAANLSLRDSYREELANRVTAENKLRNAENEVRRIEGLNKQVIEVRNHWWRKEGERTKQLRACQTELALVAAQRRGREAQLEGAGKDMLEVVARHKQEREVWDAQLLECRSQREEWKKEAFDLRRRLQDEYNKVPYTPVFLQVGEVYTEMRDGEVIEREIEEIKNNQVLYVNRQDMRLHDGRRKCSVQIFETLVRAGLFRLKTPTPTFDDKGNPTAGFQVGDVWVSTGGWGERVIDKLEDGEITYRHRHQYTGVLGKPAVSIYSNSVVLGGMHRWKEYVGAEAKLLRGRLTDYHCVCGSTCRGNDTHHWCVNPECKHVGVVCPSKVTL